MNEGWVLSPGLGPWILEGVKILATAAITISTLRDGPNLLSGGSDDEKRSKYNKNVVDRIQSIYYAFDSENETETEEETE